MTSHSHRGHCLCGSVKFEADAEPKWIAYCHCASCRRHTGSAVATFVGFDEARFRYIGGKPAEYESSPMVWRGFCTRCGTPISYRAARFPGEIHVYVGAMDHPERYVPTAHVYFAEHLPWFDTTDTCMRYSTTSSG